jgi:single-strand DNA-binding protein
MNSTNFIGRLTADPELRRTDKGTACCSFSLAVKRPRAKDITDFLNFVVWQQGAEYLCQYGHKGDLVGVSGYLTTRNWEDKNGNKRVVFEVTCDSVELISSKKNSEGNSNTSQRQNGSYSQPSYPQQSFEPITDPDVQLPF